ncbi:MAG: NADP oxidoreductase [Bacillati bacterium ANGP1]|uniref:NADP oxidoreductase n=1 Tax=Candidatus Segetimicrobium genomatis TaxID=2569760 RepID=A0A537IKZ2_9BACT|nr:MAG: NADP oxidoreductase [Terrabacteria group bacterium ANGP1]
MKLGVLGTGMAGHAIGTKLVQMGQDVMMGSRSSTNEKAAAWVKANGPKASQGTFADAAKFGEILFNCTHGMASLDALKLAGAENMKGKILIDLANPLDFSKGMPPTLAVSNTDSLAEQIQRAFPDTKVVKSLNTMNCKLMVNPSLVRGDHDVFVSGNDKAAKSRVTEILRNWFGWKSVVDLGDIGSARGAEQLLPLWLRLVGALGTANFNLKIVK